MLNPYLSPSLSGWWFWPLWKIWVRQWEGWHPIKIMENKNVWNHQPVVQCLLDPQGSTKRPILPLGRIAAGLAGTQLSSISQPLGLRRTRHSSTSSKRKEIWGFPYMGLLRWSMDWFKGKFSPESPHIEWKILEKIHWDDKMVTNPPEIYNAYTYTYIVQWELHFQVSLKQLPLKPGW